jgi:hypothetical protein
MCVPDEVGNNHHDTDTGYKCRIDGDSAATAPSPGRGESARNLGQQPARQPSVRANRQKVGTKSKVRRQAESAQSFKQRVAPIVNAEKQRTLKERRDLIARLIRSGKRRGVKESAVAEAVGAVLLDCKLQSLGDHGFDLRGHMGGKCVIVDAKHSRTRRGYNDSYGGRRGGKAHKIQESIDNPDCVPAYLAFVEGHGLYLHPGIDPKQTAEFQTDKGRATARGVSTPRGAAGVINKGAGQLVPFVQLSRKYKSLATLNAITQEDLVHIQRRAAATFREINMAKLRQHLTKQRREADEDGRQVLAKRDPVATARAGVSAMTPEQRKAFAKELLAQTRKK